MPKVGKMKFPYTEQGIKEAASYAKNSGKAMEMEGGGMIPKYRGGGMVPNRPMNPRFRYGLGSGMAPRMRPMRPNPGMGNRPNVTIPGGGTIPIGGGGTVMPDSRRSRIGSRSFRHPGGPGGYHVRYKKGGKVK